MRKLNVLIIVVLLIAFICLFVGLSQRSELNNGLRITMLNVGQGDSFLVQSPDGKSLLIDAGSDRTALTELKSTMGLFSGFIDTIIISHPDNDHKGGLDEVLAYYRYGNLIESATENSDFYLGCCVYIDFVWPVSKMTYDIDNTNDGSLAFYLKYNDFTAFFAGDLTSEREDYIARNFGEDIDLLKVSHHGSAYSTSNFFLDLLKPEIGIISVGLENKYNHPSESTLDRLDDHNVSVIRSDQDGRVTLNY